MVWKVNNIKENNMDINAVLTAEKPEANQIAKKINFRSAVVDIKSRLADYPKDITNRINWIVRDTILATDYYGPTRAPKFTPEEQKELIKVLASALKDLPKEIENAINEYVGIIGGNSEKVNASDETGSEGDQEQADGSTTGGDEGGEEASVATNKVFNY